jgi:hypothetical protein
MSVVARLFVMFLAYILACIAASAVFTIGLLAPQWSHAAGDLPAEPALLALTALGAPVLGFIAFVPAALVVAIAEGFGWRSALVYAALGGGLALALSYGVHLTGDDITLYLPREHEVEAASGIAGGLVYWLFAGRNAGSWS